MDSKNKKIESLGTHSSSRHFLLTVDVKRSTQSIQEIQTSLAFRIRFWNVSIFFEDKCLFSVESASAGFENRWLQYGFKGAVEYWLFVDDWDIGVCWPSLLLKTLVWFIGVTVQEGHFYLIIFWIAISFV